MEPRQQQGRGGLYYHQNYQQQQQQQQILNAGVGQVQEERERLPQWSQAETREFLRIRAELDQSFMETKRNKLLWEVVSTRMREKGFSRTPDQCKCKWKNLVTRYKGHESMEGAGEMASATTRQFPFQAEMRAIFTARMERLLSFEEGKKEPPRLHIWSEDEEEEGEEEQQQEEEASNKKRRTTSGRARNGGRVRVGGRGEAVDVEEVKKAMREFMEWQMQMEAQWAKAAEAREVERRVAEREWRRVMAALAEQRAELHRRWREREEERRTREEERAERRHQLVVAVLTRLANRNT